MPAAADLDSSLEPLEGEGFERQAVLSCCRLAFCRIWGLDSPLSYLVGERGCGLRVLPHLGARKLYFSAPGLDHEGVDGSAMDPPQRNEVSVPCVADHHGVGPDELAYRLSCGIPSKQAVAAAAGFFHCLPGYAGKPGVVVRHSHARVHELVQKHRAGEKVQDGYANQLAVARAGDSHLAVERNGGDMGCMPLGRSLVEAPVSLEMAVRILARSVLGIPGARLRQGRSPAACPRLVRHSAWVKSTG